MWRRVDSAIGSSPLNATLWHWATPRCWPDVVDELDVAARSRQLWELVDGLPPTQADLIRRAYVSGQTHQEIASATGLPLGTVKSRIRLGLDKLRGALQNATLLSVEC
jgi:DNA-directed RNA polymerase specialized sigma24 family protein